MKRTCTRADDAIFQRVAMRHLSLPGREPIPLAGGGWQRGWELKPIDAPAGGIVSSAADLLRWLRFWLGRQDDGGTPPLEADLRARACEDQLPPWNPTSGQGLGWAVRNDPAARVLNHGGLSAGYCSYTLVAPALDLAMVVLTNSTSGGLVHTELTRWLVGEVGGRAWSDPVPLSAQPELAPYTGAYWGSFGTTRVRGVDGELEMATERHSTDDGAWQPPPEPPLRARLCARRLPSNARVEPGTLIDFESGAAAAGCAGGRISFGSDVAGWPRLRRQSRKWGERERWITSM
jgi:CubicO group peptidase (beta-lactamase class C family)